MIVKGKVSENQNKSSLVLQYNSKGCLADQIRSEIFINLEIDFFFQLTTIFKGGKISKFEGNKSFLFKFERKLKVATFTLSFFLLVL